MKRIPNEGPERYGLQYELHNSNIGDKTRQNKFCLTKQDFATCVGKCAAYIWVSE